MDFRFTPEQEVLRKTAREFAEKWVAPRVDEMDKTGKLPMDLVKKMAELGFMGCWYLQSMEEQEWDTLPES